MDPDLIDQIDYDTDAVAGADNAWRDYVDSLDVGWDWQGFCETPPTE